MTGFKKTTILISIIIISILILEGCSSSEDSKVAKKDLFQQIGKIESLVDSSKWEHAGKEVNVLNDMERKGRWKLQLLGDETEYEGIDRDIQQLKASVKAKDKTESLVFLANIRAFLEDIYSL